jgi:hypothetical protein
MIGKFDSYRDSALHYLCSSEWGNESFGDCSTYGVYIWRISNTPFDVSDRNNEFNSVIQEWEEDQPELEGTLEKSFEEFRKSLVGHFLVSESDTGAVTVKQFTLESELIRHFNQQRDHYNEFMEEEEPEQPYSEYRYEQTPEGHRDFS